MLRPECRPPGAEVEPAVGMAEAVEEMPGLEPRPAIEPDAFLERLGPRQPAGVQRRFNQFEGGHREAGMPRAQPLARPQITSWLERHSPMGRHDGAADLQKRVAAGGIEVVMFEKGRRRQHDVGHRGRLGQELLVDADEQIVAAEALVHQSAIPGETTIGLVFWMSRAVTGGPSPRSRLSPQRIGPMRDWSRMRVRSSTTSSPSISRRSSGSMPWFE